MRRQVNQYLDVGCEVQSRVGGTSGEETNVVSMTLTLLNVESCNASETDTKDTVKNFSTAEDELSNEDANRFLSGAGQLVCHSLDDP